MTDPLDNEAISEEETAFTTFVALLRERLDERGLVKTWVVWDKDTVDTTLPSESMLPWVRLTPQAGDGVKRMPLGTVDAPIRVMIETSVSGLDAARRMRFWAAIRRSLFPADPAKRKTFVADMAKVGVRLVSIVKPSYGVDAITEDGVIVSSGIIDLLLTVPGA
jgi:hypothetical protein